MTIYLDIVFLENLCMNYIILFATAYIMKNKINQIRIVLSSCLGSVYAILVYLQESLFFSNIIIKIMLSVVMVLIAFKPPKIKIFFKQIIIFYLISFVFGGCAFFLLYFVRPQDVLIRNGVYVGRYPLKIALLGGIVGFTITQIAFKFIKGKITKKDILADLIIYYKQQHISLKAFIDTGNMLKDPISGLPVIVVEKNKLYNLFPKKLLDNTERIINGNMPEDLLVNEEDVLSKIRIIPFSSLGKENGILLGIKADKVNIWFEELSKDINNVIIGIYEKKFCKSDEYAALIGLNFFEESEENEFASNIKIKY